MNSPAQEAKEKIDNVERFSACLPKPLYHRLVEVLRSPFSMSPEGQLDRGVMSAWLREAATTTIEGRGRLEVMELFISSKGLLEEFEAFYQANSNITLEELL